jgi:hypothetical protein
VVFKQRREALKSRLWTILFSDLIQPPLKPLGVAIYEPRYGFTRS